MPQEWNIKEYKDIETQNMWHAASAELQDDQEKMRDFMRQMQLKARDHARTPVHWSSEEHAGFSTSLPWMRVNEDYLTWNAQTQTSRSDSVFTFWKHLLKLRKQRADVFVYGDFKLLDRNHRDVFCYRRSNVRMQALVVLNCSSEPVQWTVPNSIAPLLASQTLLLHNYAEVLQIVQNCQSPRPFEAVVWLRETPKTHL